MLIYYLIWGIVSLFAIFEVSNSLRVQPVYQKITGLGIWIIWSGLVCFKGAVGTDYYSYQHMIEKPSSINEDFVEPLFILWVKVLLVFTSSFPIFWMITGFLNISL